MISTTHRPNGPPKTLSGPAYAGWQAVLGGGTADEIAAATCEIAGVAIDEVTDDVRDFLQVLVDERLVVAHRSAWV